MMLSLFPPGVVNDPSGLWIEHKVGCNEPQKKSHPVMLSGLIALILVGARGFEPPTP